MTNPTYVPMEVLCNHFSVSPSTIRKWVREGYITPDNYIKAGMTYRFHLERITTALTPTEATGEPKQKQIEQKELEVGDEDLQLAFEFNTDDDI